MGGYLWVVIHHLRRRLLFKSKVCLFKIEEVSVPAKGPIKMSHRMDCIELCLMRRAHMQNSFTDLKRAPAH